jgi:hypothetical protein
MTRVFRVCFELLITILGTPEDGLARPQTSRPHCSTTVESQTGGLDNQGRNRALRAAGQLAASGLFLGSISRVSKWFFPQALSENLLRILRSVHFLGNR